MTYLTQIKLFSLLTEEKLNLIDDIISETKFKKGKYIFFEGKTGDKFFIIKDVTKMIKKVISRF